LVAQEIEAIRTALNKCGYRRRNDAESHLRVLRRLVPEANYAIVFDPALDRQDSSDEGE
jgi:hypothetical protein